MHVQTDQQPNRDSTIFQMTVRVGYHETDGQRRVHHANYLNYFEQSRVEMLRRWTGLSAIRERWVDVSRH